MACEVSLGAFRYAATAPGDEDIFGEAGVGVFHLDEGILDTAFAEVLDQVGQFSIWNKVNKLYPCDSIPNSLTSGALHF